MFNWIQQKNAEMLLNESHLLCPIGVKSVTSIWKAYVDTFSLSSEIVVNKTPVVVLIAKSVTVTSDLIEYINCAFVPISLSVALN